MVLFNTYSNNVFCQYLCVCVCVCVCVCGWVGGCACVRAWVCVDTLPPWILLLSVRCLRHTWGVRINDTMLWAPFQVFLPSSHIYISKSVIFYLQRQNFSSPTTGEKMIWYIWFRENAIYIDIGYKSATQQTGKWQKDTKYKEATLI